MFCLERIINFPKSDFEEYAPAESLLRQIEHLFKAHYVTKIRFAASERPKVGLGNPK